jgi:hypothetical protein
MKRHIDRIICSLALVRFGQELGSDSQAAQTIAHGIDWLIGTFSRLIQ